MARRGGVVTVEHFADGVAFELAEDGTATAVVFRVFYIGFSRFNFSVEETKYAFGEAKQLLSTAKKIPCGLVGRLIYRLFLLSFFLFQFLYPIIAFAVDGENVLFNVLCMVISLAGLLAQILDLKKLWIDLKRVYKYCRARSRGEEYDINTEEKTCCDCEIECCSGPCGSIFNEFVLGFLGELLIYPSAICNIVGFINGRSWEFESGWDGMDTILVVVSVLTDLVYAKWQYVIQLSRAMYTTYQKYDEAIDSKLTCKQCCNKSRLCTPTALLPVYCFLLSVLHVAMLLCISFRVYADNFYAVAVNHTITINGTMTVVTEHVRPEEGAYHLSGFTWYMMITGAVIPLVSIALYLYFNQYWFLQLLYVIRSKEDKTNSKRAKTIENIPDKEKFLSLLCNPLSFLLGPVLVSMMIFFILGTVGYDYGDFYEQSNALPEGLVTTRLILLIVIVILFVLTNIQAVIVYCGLGHFYITCFFCYRYHHNRQHC